MTDLKPPPEGIRAWYSRTTRRAIRSIVWSTAIAAVFAVVGYFAASDEITLRLNNLNGAWTIPAFGGIWLAAFILIWLVPMREVSFRGQESMERIEKKFIDTFDAIDKGDHPVVKRLLDRFDEMAADIRKVRERAERDTTPAVSRKRRPEKEGDFVEAGAAADSESDPIDGT